MPAYRGAKVIRLEERGTARDRMRERERERAKAKPEPASPRTYGHGQTLRRETGHVTAVGGRALRTRQGYPIRYVGDDIVVDLPDGSQEIYCGREGRAEAIRNGVLGVRLMADEQ